MLKVFDKPLIQHMIERVKKSKLISELWLAILIQRIIMFKKFVRKQILFVMLDRTQCFVKICQNWPISKPNLIVRLTGDCPMHGQK